MSEQPILLKSVLIFTNPKGQHNSSMAYQKMDEVQYQTSIYVATEDIPAGVAISDSRWVRKLDNSAAYAAEQARQEAEGLREGAEVDRETAEGLREEGEAARNTAYTEAEGVRDSQYATAESARDDLFAGSQQDRTSAYNLREGQRDSAYDAQELVRDGLYSTAEAARDLLNANAEAAREALHSKWANPSAVVEMLEPEADPEASFDIGETGVILNLDIPRGTKGDTGAKIVTAAWSGNDLLLTLDDTSTVTLAGAKTTLKGDTGNGITSILRTSGDGTPGTTDTYTITFDDDSTTTFPVYNGADGDISNIKVDGATKTKAAGVVDLTSDFSRYATWRKTTGNPVSAYPVPESPLYPKVSGTFTQAGTGDPSPENIRPITPWLASGGKVGVKRTGKNLFNVSRTETQTTPLDTSKWWKGCSGSVEYSNYSSVSIDGSGVLTVTSNAGGYGACFMIPVFAGKSYAISFSASKISSGSYIGYSFHTSDGTVIGSTETKTVTSFSLTAPDGAMYMLLCFRLPVADGECKYSNIQIELGSVATPYEPYSGDEIALTAPQEIPAGWMDNEGNGQVTWAKKVFDGTELWGTDTLGKGNRYFVYNLGSMNAYGNGGGMAVSDRYIHSTTGYNRIFYFGSAGYINLLIYPNSTAENVEIPDVAAWKSYLATQYSAGTPVTVLYKLATPIRIPLTDLPAISALPQLDRITPRQNVLTASTGNIELTYAKSPIRESDEIATAIAAL